MKNQNLSLNNIIFYIKIRIHLFVVLISLISIISIFLRIVNFNSFSGISQIVFLDWIFHLIVYTSTGFALLFLPMYPIIFIIFKENNLNFLERMTISIVINLSFYVIVGILGFYLGFALTDWFFFIILVIMYFLLILSSSIFNLKKGKSNICCNLLKDEYCNNKYELLHAR